MDLPATVREFPKGPLGRGLHLAIGMFDGVHLGHCAVIESAVHAARNDNEYSGVLTFSPHPSKLLRPDAATRLILPDALKEQRLRTLDIDLLIIKEFTREFAAVTAEDFLPHLKRAMPTLSSVHVGENFRFGKGRKGDIAQLVASGQDCGVHVYSVERLRLDGEPISSTRIRGDLEAGDIRSVNRLLGYPYFSVGPVQTGRKLGRTIGFPTLNIAWEPELRPRFGVYAVRVRRSGEDHSVPGVANYGLRPTVNDGDKFPLLEVHLLENAEFQTGDELCVEWREFIRSEQKFAGLDELKAQIAKDKTAAEAFFEER